MSEDKHLLHYIFLFVGLLVFVALFILFRYHKPTQLFIGCIGVIFYVMWGILHHAVEDRLTRFVILEYLLFGGLAFLLLLTAFFF